MLDVLRRNRAAGAVALYLLVAVALVIIERPAGDEPLGPAGAAALQVAGRSHDAAHIAGAGIGDAWDRYVDLIGVRAENERLRADVDRLRDENTRLLGVMQQNERLRALVGFRDAYPRLELVPARVVSIDTSAYFRVNAIRIAPSQRRVEVGMPVVASAGVVGYVSEVSSDIALVTLAVDPRSSIDVVVQRNRARGILEGLGHDRDYGARVAFLLQRDAVQPGDILVTSGLDGRFPPDLVAGRIRALVGRDAGLFQEVLVEPAVDFSRVEEVFVIVGEVR